MQSIYGLKVIVSDLIEDEPRMKLSPVVPVSDKFRIEYDKWLRDFFGTKPSFIIAQDKIFLNSSVFEKLKLGVLKNEQ